MNAATSALIGAVEEYAEKEDRSTEDVMKELMSEPGQLLPVLFTAENMKQLMPEGLQEVCSLRTVVKGFVCYVWVHRKNCLCWVPFVYQSYELADLSCNSCFGTHQSSTRAHASCIS